MIKAIIIDDEANARKLLAKLIENSGMPLNIVDECADLPNAVKSIRKHKPDLVFLDIEMPGHSGLEIVDFFGENEIDFGIIFTTAYNQYAIKAIKLHAVDYLLKPIDAEELTSAIKRFDNKFLQPISKQEQTPDTKIAVPTGQTIKLLSFNQIIYLEAENVYTVIHLSNNEKITVSRTLKNFEETLTTHKNFLRTHKSYIVNKSHIKDYVKSEGGYLIMSNNSKIPINSDKVEIALSNTISVKRP